MDPPTFDLLAHNFNPYCRPERSLYVPLLVASAMEAAKHMNLSTGLVTPSELVDYDGLTLIPLTQRSIKQLDHREWMLAAAQSERTASHRKRRMWATVCSMV